MQQQQSETKTYTGKQFKGWYGGGFASLIHYDQSGNDALSYGLNNMPRMVEFYKAKDVTKDVAFVDISEITIPDDAHVEVANDKFWTDKIFVEGFWTRVDFLANGSSFLF